MRAREEGNENLEDARLMLALYADIISTPVNIMEYGHKLEND